MGWLLYAPVLPLGRLHRLAFVASCLVLTGIAGVALFAVGPPMCYICAAILLWPQFCIQARRLHDIGASALWSLLPWSVEAVCLTMVAVSLAPMLTHPQSPPDPGLAVMGTVAGGVWLLVALGFFVFLAVRPSKGETPRGEPTLAPGAPLVGATADR